MDHTSPSVSDVEFHLREYAMLREEIMELLKYVRSLEQMIVIAVGVTWAWLFEKKSSLPHWPWFVLTLFVLLGVTRMMGIRAGVQSLHEYLLKVEERYFKLGLGWEHFKNRPRRERSWLTGRKDRTHMFTSRVVFWGILGIITVIVGIIETR